MKKITLFVVLAVASISAMAIPARPVWRNVTQPDGSVVEVRLTGDEYGHAYVDRSGNVLRKDADGFFRPISAAELRSARKAAQVKRSQSNVRRMQGMTKAAISGEIHIPVILVEFSDRKFKDNSLLTIKYSDTPVEAFNKILNQEGYSYNGAVGSVRDFFIDNSNGVYRPVFDVYPVQTLSGKMKDYGANDDLGNDVAPELAIYQAVKALDSSVDFSQYDKDNDGIIDMILMYYAGDNEAEAGSDDTIWPHQWSIQEIPTTSTNRYIAGEKFDNKKLGKYFCTSEVSIINLSYDALGNAHYDLALCGIGTTCHEFAHSLGLPDFYDTDYAYNASAGGTYNYDTMCSGSYNKDGNAPPFFGAEELLMLGWMDSLTDLPSGGSISIPALSKTDKVAYKGTSSTSGEYFVFECRGTAGWDKYIDEGPGLLVYHVDKSSFKVEFPDNDGQEQLKQISATNLWNNWESSNSINAAGRHPCYYIIPAGCQNYTADTYFNSRDPYSGKPSPTTGLNYSGSDFTFGTSSKYSEYTPVDWKKTTMDYTLKNISYSNGSVSFSLGLDLCYIVAPAQLANGYTWTPSVENAPVGSKTEWYMDDVKMAGSSFRLTAGHHVVEALITYGGKTRRVELEFEVE